MGRSPIRERVGWGLTSKLREIFGPEPRSWQLQGRLHVQSNEPAMFDHDIFILSYQIESSYALQLSSSVQNGYQRLGNDLSILQWQMERRRPYPHLSFPRIMLRGSGS